MKNRVLPEPDPPTTRTFLFLAYFGIFGLLLMVILSDCDRITLFANTGSYKMKTDPLPFHRNRIVLFCLPFESPSCFRSAVSTLLKHYNYISTLTVPDLHSTVPIAE